MRRLIPLILIPLTACTSQRLPPELPVEGGVIVAYPFAPASLRVHPLTHVEAGWERAGTAPEQAQLILHFELLDRYGDSVKGLGRVRVELYRPAGDSPAAGVETQELSWDVEGMELPEANTRRFDMATRTYRVPLVTPNWVHEHVSTGGWLKVRVTMTTPGVDGEQTLEDEYVIQS